MMKGGRERISWRSRGIGKPRPFDVSERLAIGPTLQHFAMLATWALFRDEEQKIQILSHEDHERGVYPRDRRRWDAALCKLVNVSVSLRISGPRTGKNHPLPIFAGPDTMATLLSSEKSFKREHHGSAENFRRSFLDRGTRGAPPRIFFTTSGEVRSSAFFGSSPGHSETVSRTPLRRAAFRRSPATVTR